MERFLSKYSPYLYAILRILAGVMYAMHGSQKLFGSPGGNTAVPVTPLMAVAGLIEVIGGLMIAFAILTGYAAFIASGEMAAAYFLAHAPRGALPIVNHGELPVLFCFLFLYIAAQGSGVWSLVGITRRKM